MNSTNLNQIKYKYIKSKMHSVIFISIRNIESERNTEQNKFTNCNNLFPNPIILHD